MQLQNATLDLPEATAFQAITGKGVQAQVNGNLLHIGNRSYFANLSGTGFEDASQHVERLQNEGKTSVLVAKLNEQQQAQILGVIAFADVLRPDARRSCAHL